jgi:hypothetical protein
LSDPKKTGSRDISELKQRLGLKKGGQQTGQTAARGNGAPSGGVVPPPGLSLPSQPPQPAIPNAADDPFGAMNAMAAVGTVQRAPEIVIVHDGKPVENMHSGSGSLLKIIIPAILGIVVGIAVGKIGTAASFYNDGLKGTRAILGDKTQPTTVSGLKKQLSDLETDLEDARTKKGFHQDPALDKQLAAIAAKLEVKSEQLGLARNTNPELAGQILGFYAGVAEVKAMLDAHVKAATFDDVMFKKGKTAEDAATLKDTENALLAGQPRYAVYVQAPTETDKVEFGAKIVELSGVYCNGSKAQTPKCAEGESPSAFAYRNEPGGAAIQGDLVTSGQDSIPSKKILMLLPNAVRDSLIKGTEPTASDVYYMKRLKTIYERIHGRPGQDGKAQGGLLEDGNKLETRLQTEASKSARFSFFM